MSALEPKLTAADLRVLKAAPAAGGAVKSDLAGLVDALRLRWCGAGSMCRDGRTAHH